MTKRPSAVSWHDLAWFVVSPIASLVINPIQLVRTLRACLVLRAGRPGDYSAFAFAPALGRSFYGSVALNLRRYGRQGVSPLLGWGAYPMSYFWYQSLVAVSFDARVGGVVTAFIGMAGWIVSHGVWLNDPAASRGMILLLVALAVCTNNFYGNVFGWQNYNILGWAAFPAVVYGIVAGDRWVLAVAATIAGMFSLTVVAMTGALALLVAWGRHDGLTVLALAPAVAIILSRAVAFAGVDTAARLGHLSRLLKAIGASRGASRYRRRRYVWQSFAMAAILGILPAAIVVRGASAYGLSAAVLAGLNLVPIVGFVLAETRVFRFADVHSHLFAFLTISTGTAIASADVVVMAAWWVANSNSAVGRILFNFDPDSTDAWAPAARPFDMKPVREAVENLFTDVPAGGRVWLACEDPGGEYNRLFDGYSELYELAHYCANERGVLLAPDWYAVFLHNADLTAPSIWGRTPLEATANAGRIGAAFMLVYERDGEHLVEDFKRSGWHVASSLDWSSLAGSMGSDARFAEGLRWHLLQRARRENVLE